MEDQPTVAEDPGISLTEILEKMFLLRSTSQERSWFAQWFGKNHPEVVVEAMLSAIGDRPLRQGLRRTPRRVVRSWKELFSGYNASKDEVFTPGSDHGFDCEKYDQMVVLRHIPFTSFCEHHLLPFTGTAHVAYIPGEDGTLLGISKLARLVEIHARRLQNQERITQDVAEDLIELSGGPGSGVQLIASHSCMSCRGVLKPGSEMVTTALRGVFLKPEVRAEFLSTGKL